MTEAPHVNRDANPAPPLVSEDGTSPKVDESKPKPDEEGSSQPPPPGGNTTNGNIDTQILGNIGNAFFGPRPPKAFAKLLADLPDLSPPIYPFRDPNHESLVAALKTSRLVVLMSYGKDAAYSAAQSLVRDPSFENKKRRALYPYAQQEKNRTDVELMSLASEGVLGQEPQILLVEINRACTFLESVIDAGNGLMSTVCQTLRRQDSYLVLALDERLLENDDQRTRIREIGTHSVSHLRYLLSRDHADRAETLEAKLLAVLGPRPTPKALAEHYDHVADEWKRGAAAFDEFLTKLDQFMQQPAETEEPPPVEPPMVFRDDLEAHRSAVFVAVYLPELNQRDFDSLVCLLLGDATTPVETKRPAFRRDGRMLLIQEETSERWSDRWTREADGIFHDCRLRTVVSGDGSWVVDFSHPSLRDELRKHLEMHHPWYLRRQCQRLQNTGVLFDPDLSLKGVEGLVQLFVERAIVDPTGFGSNWLLDLVLGARAALTDDPRPKDPEKALEWRAEQFAKARLRELFLRRFTMLIREMLSRGALHHVVDEFLTRLIHAREHDALLDVILEIAPRLRFVPHFDPLAWMRRLLDQGSRAVVTRTIDCLTGLARDSRFKIYEVLATIRTWLPEEDCARENFSVSNHVAFQFLFLYCAVVAERVDPGAWPSQHPLFYALPDDQEKARRELATLVEWILDARGAVLDDSDAVDPLRSSESAWIGHVADLIEHWAWVLEGEGESGPPDGRALFRVITEELGTRLGPRERTWLQRSWQQRQDKLLLEASNPAKSVADRRICIARKKKLEELRLRFATFPPTLREL